MLRDCITHYVTFGLCENCHIRADSRDSISTKNNGKLVVYLDRLQQTHIQRQKVQRRSIGLEEGVEFGGKFCLNGRIFTQMLRPYGSVSDVELRLNRYGF